jgi:hypothetical protein
VYASSAENVIQHGYDPVPVVPDPKLFYDKPVGFPWLAAPLYIWWHRRRLRTEAVLRTGLRWLVPVFATLAQCGDSEIPTPFGVVVDLGLGLYFVQAR